MILKINYANLILENYKLNEKEINMPGIRLSTFLAAMNQKSSHVNSKVKIRGLDGKLYNIKGVQYEPEEPDDGCIIIEMEPFE
ncbi:MAG TPA: hypothetical protein P5052_02070 [Candidatus Paceibacterota bacterium]|nr:hypothetical protein [Candidatus Paceibacterota bacterium]